jgi:hypothetical protein
MNSLWGIRILLGLVPKETPCNMTSWLYDVYDFKKPSRKLSNL